MNKTVVLEFTNITPQNCRYKFEKAIHAVSKQLGIPVSVEKQNTEHTGEAFAFASQEQLTYKWYDYFNNAIKEVYYFVADYFDLPIQNVLQKAGELIHRGQILYSPETGKPIKKADWDRFVKALEKILNQKFNGSGEKIVLESKALGKLLDRMLKYNKLPEVKDISLSDIRYSNKTFDYIAESTNTAEKVFGAMDNTRIELIQQSAAERISGMTDELKTEVKQTLIDGIKSRKGKQQISQDLFNRLSGTNRDFRKIADTEIQNNINNSFIEEEVSNAEAGEKVYFQRIEIVDGATCPFCKKMNGVIAVWSETPLSNDKVDGDPYATVALWEGKDWNGQKNYVANGAFHPYCRGIWTRWNSRINAYSAMLKKRSEDYNKAINKAREEWKAKGIENPNDKTPGYIDRINELYNGTIQKSLTWSGYELQDRYNFAGLKISVENKKGSTRSGKDKDGHEWHTFMHYDYGYIRGTEGTDGDHLDCVSPDTKILMANYTEKRADEIVLGDELVGIEIETHQYQQRKQIKTKVVNLSKGVDEMLEITLSNGVKLNTTKGHLHYIFKNRRDKIWKRADELKVGDRLTGIFNHKDLAETEDYKKGYLYGAYLGDGSVSFDETKQVYCDIRKGVAYADVIYRVKRFWNDLGLETSDVRIKQARQTKSLLKDGRKITSKMDMAIFCIRGIDKILFVKNILVRNAESFEWCRGYLAGIYDTDGCLNNRHELQITQAKNQNEFMEFTKKCIATLGFNAVQRNNEIKLNSNLMADNITMEFTQLLKPSLEKKRNFLGQTYRFEPVEIVSIKAYKGNFIAIQTDKQTYIANGFVTHNCYIGDNEDAKNVYIIHQNDPVTNKYDEDKCMLGFDSLESAKAAYLKQYDRPGFLGSITTMSIDEFKDYVLAKENHGERIQP